MILLEKYARLTACPKCETQNLDSHYLGNKTQIQAAFGATGRPLARYVSAIIEALGDHVELIQRVCNTCGYDFPQLPRDHPLECIDVKARW